MFQNQLERRPRRTRVLTTTLGVCAGLLVATMLDFRAYWLFAGVDRSALDGSNRYHMLLAPGYIEIWGAIAVAFFLHDRRRPGAWRRGLPLVLAPALSGAAAEILKLLIGRERPIAHGGIYYFKPFLGALQDGRDLGVPSSHAAVAFGGAFMLSFLHPRVAPVAIGVAAICAWARLYSGAHFLSDVYVAGVIGYLIARALRPRLSSPRL